MSTTSTLPLHQRPAVQSWLAQHGYTVEHPLDAEQLELLDLLIDPANDPCAQGADHDETGSGPIGADELDANLIDVLERYERSSGHDLDDDQDVADRLEHLWPEFGFAFLRDSDGTVSTFQTMYDVRGTGFWLVEPSDIKYLAGRGTAGLRGVLATARLLRAQHARAANALAHWLLGSAGRPVAQRTRSLLLGALRDALDDRAADRTDDGDALAAALASMAPDGFEQFVGDRVWRLLDELEADLTASFED